MTTAHDLHNLSWAERECLNLGITMDELEKMLVVANKLSAAGVGDYYTLRSAIVNLPPRLLDKEQP